MIVFTLYPDPDGVLEGTTNWYGYLGLAAVIAWVTQPFLAVRGGAVCLRAPP
jgi:hypothetical protein